MIKINSLLSFLLFFLLLSLGLNAQSKILDKYIRQALVQNLTIQQTDFKRNKQLNRIEQAKKLSGPSVNLDASYLLAKGGRTLNFPIGDLFNPTYATLNQLTGNNQFPTNLENVETQLTPNNFIDAQLSVSVPIINSSIKYNRKIQETLLKLEDLNIDQKKEVVVFEIKSAYYNYLKSLEGIRILNESEKLLQEVLVFNRKLVKFDKATDEIIFDVEFQIEQLKSQKSILLEQNILAQSLFNLILNRDFDEIILVDNNIVHQITMELEPLEELQNLALSQRSEFKQLEIVDEVNELNQMRIKKEAVPVIGAKGGVGIQSEDFNFDDGGPLYTIGLGMGFSLFDNGLRKKKMEELAIDKIIVKNNRKQLEQKIEIEVIQIYYGLKSLISRMQSETAAERSAEKSLERFKTRYENDKALLIEFLQAQSRLTTSKLSKTLTKYDFLIKKAELKKAINL